jgi:hypothetical protein
LEVRQTDSKKTRKAEKSSAKDFSNVCITAGLVKGSYLILPEYVPSVVCGCFELYGTFEDNVFK